MTEPWVAVDVSDVTDRWRPLTTIEASTAPTIIQDAQDMLEDQLGDIGFLSAPVPEDVRWERKYVRVVATMVKRVLSNPDGYLSETGDDYTYRRDSAVSAGLLYVDETELDVLRVAQRRRYGAFSIVPQ